MQLQELVYLYRELLQLPKHRYELTSAIDDLENYIAKQIKELIKGPETPKVNPIETDDIPF